MKSGNALNEKGFAEGDLAVLSIEGQLLELRSVALMTTSCHKMDLCVAVQVHAL